MAYNFDDETLRYYTQKLKEILAEKDEIPTKTSDLTNDSGYLTTLPTASSTTLGGIRVGSGLSIDENGVLSASGEGSSGSVNLEDYQTKVDNSLNTTDKTIVGAINELNMESVKAEDYEDSSVIINDNITSRVSNLETNKVDKVEGKQLSTEDYTTEEKNKLNGIEANANNYVLPIASNTTVGGIKVGSGLNISSDGTLSSSGGGGIEGTVSIEQGGTSATDGYTAIDNLMNKFTTPTTTTLNYFKIGTITLPTSWATCGVDIDIFETAKNSLFGHIRIITKLGNSATTISNTSITWTELDNTEYTDKVFLYQEASDTSTIFHIYLRHPNTEANYFTFRFKYLNTSYDSTLVLNTSGVWETSISGYTLYTTSTYSGGSGDLTELTSRVSNLETNKADKTEIPTSLPANGGNANTVGGYSIWSGTRTEYNSIVSKSNTTIYFIIGE